MNSCHEVRGSRKPIEKSLRSSFVAIGAYVGRSHAEEASNLLEANPSLRDPIHGVGTFRPLKAHRPLAVQEPSPRTRSFS